jgi:hypothetical protein
MALYTTSSQPILQPSYTTTFHHPAAAHPHLYQTPAYSVPTVHSSPSYTMPTYYVQSSPSHHHRSRSNSHSGYNQPVIYTPSSGNQYLSPHSDSGRRRRSSSVGHGGHYYTTSNHSSSHRSSHSPNYYTSSPSQRRRSHSTSRPSGTQYVDVRHSSSNSSHGHHHPSVSYVRTFLRTEKNGLTNDYLSFQSNSGHHHRRHSDSLGDRFRRWFGVGEHHSSSRGTEYVDARTGRPVDRSGRPIYRV